MISKFEMELGGRVLELETGRIAGLAGGAVTARYGDTFLLVTATASKKPRTGIDFLPLTIDVAEKAYAAGKLPGGFFKREGRPNTEAILNCRLIDRPLRPLFPKNYHNEVQIIVSVMSSDMVHPYSPIGIIGASAALAISDVPFNDPIGACVIGLLDGELVVNPTYQDLEKSQLDLTVAGTGDAIMMVEAGANFVSESVLLDALQLAQEVNGAIVEQIREMQAKVGKTKLPAPEPTPELQAAQTAVRERVGERIKEAMAGSEDKTSRQAAVDAVMDEALEALSGDHDSGHVQTSLWDLEKEAVREAVLSEGRRPDGRTPEEIRPLASEVGYLPRVHGSAIFARGETQVVSAVTLASLGERQRIDSLSPETESYFIHHYNFPPFSTGETGRFGFTGRREVGHGALAGRALAPVLPSQDEFPYTIRVVSDIVSSNGSTSMASVCGGTLSLMDAGVPITAPVAGIAMGLITGEDGNHAVLTDIQGAEDHTGDMDFKVAGTAEGVTALQMDIKVKGIDFKIMEQALEQARTARLKILDHLNEIIDQPREELSEFAPRMVTFKVPTDKIGAVIGPGGSVIRGMIEEFGVTIDVSDDGTVVIGSPDQVNADKTKEQIDLLTREVEVGATYKGKAVRLMPFGAFVQILPGKDGLVHISELSDHRVPDVESVVKIGDELEVMVINIDHMGRVDLSARAVIEQAKGIEPQFGSPRDRRGGSDRNGGGRERRDGGGDFRGDRRSGGGRDRRDGDGGGGRERRDGGGDFRRERRPGGDGDFRRERRPGGDGDFRRERRPGGDGDFRRERRPGGDGDFRRERRPGGDGDSRRERRPGGDGDSRRERRPGGDGDFRRERRGGGDGDFRPQGDSHPRRRVGGGGGGYPRRDRSSDDR